MQQTKPILTMETHSHMAIQIRPTINDERSNKRNEGTRMQRYCKLNDYYILDKYTGQRLDQKQTIKRLNQYEEELKKCQH